MRVIQAGDPHAENFGVCVHTKQEIVNRLGDFDILLCDCGIFGAQVCHYAYTVGKSAIAIGEALCVYFGLYTQTLEGLYPDAISLYKSKRWLKLG